MEGRKLVAKALDMDEKFAVVYPRLTKVERERQVRLIVSTYLDGAEQLKANSKSPEVYNDHTFVCTNALIVKRRLKWLMEEWSGC